MRRHFLSSITALLKISFFLCHLSLDNLASAKQEVFLNNPSRRLTANLHNTRLTIVYSPQSKTRLSWAGIDWTDKWCYFAYSVGPDSMTLNARPREPLMAHPCEMGIEVIVGDLPTLLELNILSGDVVLKDLTVETLTVNATVLSLRALRTVVNGRGPTAMVMTVGEHLEFTSDNGLADVLNIQGKSTRATVDVRMIGGSLMPISVTKFDAVGIEINEESVCESVYVQSRNLTMNAEYAVGKVSWIGDNAHIYIKDRTTNPKGNIKLDAPDGGTGIVRLDMSLVKGSQLILDLPPKMADDSSENDSSEKDSLKKDSLEKEFTTEISDDLKSMTKEESSLSSSSPSSGGVTVVVPHRCRGKLTASPGIKSGIKAIGFFERDVVLIAAATFFALMLGIHLAYIASGDHKKQSGRGGRKSE
eukprot:Selendium_serpulae@DN3732_c0_g1_i1.p1